MDEILLNMYPVFRQFKSSNLTIDYFRIWKIEKKL